VGFSVIRLDHVNVTTPQELEGQVLEWYESCLGLEPIEKLPGTRDGGGWFRLGDRELHVALDEHNPSKSAHFAVVVDHFDGVIERLRSSGCHIEQAHPIEGRHRFFTRDPAGNRIEVMVFDDPEAED
jgi:catechol 2,3-dioxygenase-like lactoylglutathione lyase family enzyme